MTVPPRDINVTYYYSTAKVRIKNDIRKYFYYYLDFYAFVNQILNINQLVLIQKPRQNRVR